MKFDTVLEHIGGFGKYQTILVIVMCLMAGWQSPALAVLYTGMSLPYSCNTAPHNDTLMQDDNHTQIHDPCIREYTWKSSTNTSEPVACTEWTYDHTEYGSSIVGKYNLVCDRSSLLSLTNSLYLFGTVVGSYPAGYFSDRFGRIRAATACFAFYIIWWYVAAFSPSYALFAVSRFLLGAGREGYYTCAFVFCMEIIVPQWRLLVGTLFNMTYSIGYMLTVGIAYALKDGLMYDLVSVIPSSASLIILILIHESPRWLLVTNKCEKATKILSRIADVNKKDKSVLEDLKNIEDISEVSTKQGGNLVRLLKSPVMRKRLLIMICDWLSCNLIYNAVTFNAKALIPGNYYLNHFLLAFMEIPGILIGAFGCRWRKTGRRLTTAILLCVPGFLCIVNVTLVMLDVNVWVTIITMLAKCCITGAYNVIYIYTVELMPTEVRNVGFSTCCILGKSGAVAATFIGQELVQIWKPLPYIIFAVCGSAGGLLSILLPETLNQPLYETIEEVEEDDRKLRIKRHTITHDVKLM